MKVLIFSDLHLHNWQYGSTVINGMNSRLRDQARVLDQIALYCQYNEVDYIFFGGDLFHTHGKIDASVLKVAVEGINKITKALNGEMFFLVGNHDTADKSMTTHSLHWIGYLDRCKVIEKPSYDYLFSALPYTEDKKVLESFFSNASQLCFMHQGMSGVPIGSGFLINEVMTKDMIPDYVKHIFTGHYHKHTRVSDKITVIGSTMQLTWADEGDVRGFLIYDTNTNKIEQIESVAPKFVTLDYKETYDFKAQGNFIRVIGFEERHIESIRKELTEAGARSVEFVQQNKEENTLLKPFTTCNEFHLPSIVAEYEKQKQVTPECSRIGKELMK